MDHSVTMEECSRKVNYTLGRSL